MKFHDLLSRVKESKTVKEHGVRGMCELHRTAILYMCVLTVVEGIVTCNERQQIWLQYIETKTLATLPKTWVYYIALG